MLRKLQDRESGSSPPLKLPYQVRGSRVHSLALSKRKDIVSSHKSGINSLQLDLVELRYLLAGASDGSLALYDTLQPTRHDQDARIDRHEALYTIGKSAKQGHKFAVSSLQWYTVDNGLFASGSFDQKVKLWDTNTMEVVLQFKLPGKVYAVKMSAAAAAHTLLAAASEDPQVRLCDVSSGAFTHTLSGHREGVWALDWSASSEWVLYTGGCDGAIRVWDIRRAGCLRVLDQHHTQTGRRPPLFKSPSGGSMLTMPSTPSTTTMSQRTSIRRSSGNERFSQRQHPGMVPAREGASGHSGAVVALQATADGLNLLSAGADSRVRLWDLDSNCNTLVNFERTCITSRKGIQIAVAPDASLVYIPKASMIQAHDMWSGKPRTVLRGHYDHVNCCVFGFENQELYSGGSDRRILVWRPPSDELSDDDMQTCLQSDADAWSD